MSKSNEYINEALGVEYLQRQQESNDNKSLEEKTTIQEILVPDQKYVSNDANEDYQLSRTTFRNLIQQGNLALEDMKELARQSESHELMKFLQQ